jgi:hypothetical protein
VQARSRPTRIDRGALRITTTMTMIS